MPHASQSPAAPNAPVTRRSCTPIGPRPSGWLLFPAAVTALLVGGYVLLRLYGAFVSPIPRDLHRLFHIGTEGGVVAWWNGTLLLSIGAVALLLAVLSGPGRPAAGRIGRASWLMVAAAAGYLSLDESAALHERLGAPVQAMVDGGGGSLLTFAWVFPGAVIAFVGCVLAARWARRLPFDLRTGLFAAIATYFTGALGLEALNGWLKRQHLDLALQLSTLVEESLEMLGCLIALSTFAAGLVLVRDPAGRFTLGLRPDLDPRRMALRGGRPGAYDVEEAKESEPRGFRTSHLDPSRSAAAPRQDMAQNNATQNSAMQHGAMPNVAGRNDAFEDTAVAAVPTPGGGPGSGLPGSGVPNSGVPGSGLPGTLALPVHRTSEDSDHLDGRADLQDPEDAALRPDPHDEMR